MTPLVKYSKEHSQFIEGRGVAMSSLDGEYFYIPFVFQKLGENIYRDWLPENLPTGLKKDLEPLLPPNAKQEAIEFFKWYGIKWAGFIHYLTQIKQQVTSNEIEEKLHEFEGQTIENLYAQYQKSKSIK